MPTPETVPDASLAEDVREYVRVKRQGAVLFVTLDLAPARAVWCPFCFTETMPNDLQPSGVFACGMCGSALFHPKAM